MGCAGWEVGRKSSGEKREHRGTALAGRGTGAGSQGGGGRQGGVALVDWLVVSVEPLYSLPTHRYSLCLSRPPFLHGCSHFTGYAGQWRTWEVLPKEQLLHEQQQQQEQDAPSPDPNTAPTITSTTPINITSKAPGLNPEPQDRPSAMCATSKGQHGIR